jgi:hypothetical protein
LRAVFSHGSGFAGPRTGYASGDRTKLLDLGEEVLDQVALAIKRSVIVAQRGPVGPRWDHGGFARGGRRLEDAFVGVERPPPPAFAGAGFRRGRLVGDQHIGRHRGQEVVRSHQVVRLAAGQDKAERIAERIDQCMDLGALSPPRERPIAWSSPAFLAPALC